MSNTMIVVLNFIESNMLSDQWFNAEDIPAVISNNNSLNILRGLATREKLSSEQDPKSLLGYERFKRIGVIA